MPRNAITTFLHVIYRMHKNIHLFLKKHIEKRKKLVKIF